MIDKQPTSVIADLASVMGHIITEGEEEAFQSETEYRLACPKQIFGIHEICRDLAKVRIYIFHFGNDIALIALSAYCRISAQKLLRASSLSSAVMDEYKFVSPSQTCTESIHPSTYAF